MKIIPFYKNEKQLIKRAVSGEPTAQRHLYEKYAPKMLAVCRRYIGDLQFAEDVMVGGFVKVFGNLGSFKNQGSFEGWIRKIMVHESISHLRKKQFVVYDDTLFEKVNVTAAKESTEFDLEHIQMLVDGLPEGYRTVFVLYVVDGYKHREIAEMLDISESTSKTQYLKARKWLQGKLKEQNIIGYGTE